MLGWLGRYRRLGTDYEEYLDTGESVVYLAIINLMTRCLCMV